MYDIDGHKVHDHMSFGSSKGTHCLNPMRYHGVSIENTYCYHPLNSDLIHKDILPLKVSPIT